MMGVVEPTGVWEVDLTRGDVRETREMFASFPDRVIALRFEADRPGALSFRVQLSRQERAVTRAVDERTLLMEGALTDGRGGDGMRFAARPGEVFALPGSVNEHGRRCDYLANVMP